MNGMTDKSNPKRSFSVEKLIIEFHKWQIVFTSFYLKAHLSKLILFTFERIVKTIFLALANLFLET